MNTITSRYIFYISIPIILTSLLIGMASIGNATSTVPHPPQGVEGEGATLPKGIQEGSLEALHYFLPNCPKKISTQALCDIRAQDNGAATLTLRVYDGYDTKRIQKTLDDLRKTSNQSYHQGNPTEQVWQESGENVGIQIIDMTAVVINPTDGHFRDEFGQETWDDGTVVDTLPEPQTAREKSADPKTAIDWGREASEFFVDFYDENNNLVSTKIYYIIEDSDPNLQGNNLPPVVRDPVKEIEQPSQTQSNTNDQNTDNENSDGNDENTQEEAREDQQGTVETPTQATEPQTVSSTDNSPSPLFYYFSDQDTVLACYAMGTTGIPTDSNPYFYYLPDQQAIMQCYSVGSALAV